LSVGELIVDSLKDSGNIGRPTLDVGDLLSAIKVCSGHGDILVGEAVAANPVLQSSGQGVHDAGQKVDLRARGVDQQKDKETVAHV